MLNLDGSCIASRSAASGVEVLIRTAGPGHHEILGIAKYSGVNKELICLTAGSQPESDPVKVCETQQLHYNRMAEEEADLNVAMTQSPVLYLTETLHRQISAHFKKKN